MRLWHEALIPLLPRQQLLGQHRECCALRGKGWGKKHATVNYVFEHPYAWLVAYHLKVMGEMERRGYHPAEEWRDSRYRGKMTKPISSSPNLLHEPVQRLVNTHASGDWIYPEHDDAYLQECLENLAGKGIIIEEV